MLNHCGVLGLLLGVDSASSNGRGLWLDVAVVQLSCGVSAGGGRIRVSSIPSTEIGLIIWHASSLTEAPGVDGSRSWEDADLCTVS